MPTLELMVSKTQYYCKLIGIGSISNFFFYIGHDENEEEHDSSNVSSEDDSFDFDDITDIRHMIAPTPKLTATDHTKKRLNLTSSGNDSIFVVMTDRKKLGTIDLHSAIINMTNRKETNTKNGQSSLSDLDDVSSDENDDFFDLPIRDEDDINNEESHVLLGGILIAAPPRSSEVIKNKSAVKNIHPQNSNYDVNRHEEIDERLNHQQGAAVIEETRTVGEKNRNQYECQPECRSHDNELCQRIDYSARCVCRPGFARMFPDRPCKRKLVSILPSSPLFQMHFNCNFFFMFFFQQQPIRTLCGWAFRSYRANHSNTKTLFEIHHRRNTRI